MSDDNQALEMVKLGDDTVSLAELAGLDFGDFDALRRFKFPVGLYSWEVIADPENGKPELKNLNGKAAFALPLKCIDVYDVKDKSECPEPGNTMSLLNKNHRETRWLTTMESLKYLKSIFADIIGVNPKELKGGLPAIAASLVGKRFDAPIVHRKNPNDSDAPPFVNINEDKIRPVKMKAA